MHMQAPEDAFLLFHDVDPAFENAAANVVISGVRDDEENEHSLLEITSLNNLVNFVNDGAGTTVRSAGCSSGQEAASSSPKSGQKTPKACSKGDDEEFKITGARTSTRKGSCTSDNNIYKSLHIEIRSLFCFNYFG